MSDVKLTKRLTAAANMLPPCAVMADIGCDHGKLAAHLILSRQCQKVIAADISAPSLDKARRAAISLGLETRMEFRLGDGLSVLRPGEAQAVFMGGMGGILLAQLIQAQRQIAAQTQALVLQPMQNARELRRYLRHNGFVITEEIALWEKGRVFELIAVKEGEPGYAGPKADFLDDMGPLLWQRREPLLLKKLERRKNELTARQQAGIECSAALEGILYAIKTLKEDGK